MITPSTSPVYLGVDIAKDSFEGQLREGQMASFANDAEGIGDYLRTLGQAPVHLVLEATGGYERLLCERLHGEGIAFSLVDPRQVRHFARSRRQWAKTDRLDAELLGAFGQAHRPPPHRRTTAACAALRELVRARRQWIEQATAERNRLEKTPAEAVAAPLREHLRYLRSLIEQMDEAIAKHIAKDRQLRALAAALGAVQGVGPVMVATSLAEMPELGSLSRSQAAAMAGVAPYNRDSGKSKAKRYIHGGRPQLRVALYMAALSAARCNPHLRPVYERLRANGKEHKVALTAVMRKLIAHLNHVAKNTIMKNK